MSIIISARVSAAQVALAHEHVGLYLDKYRARLKGKNILYLNQLRQVTKALMRFFNKSEAKFSANANTTAAAAPAAAASVTTTATSIKPSSSTAKKFKPPTAVLKPTTVTKEVFTINDLLFDLGIDNINLLKLER